jgi:hypothetical protein
MDARRLATGLGLAGMLVACASGVATSTGPSPTLPPAPATGAASLPNWTTYHRDVGRTGFDPGATRASRRLTPAWRAVLDGAVYAEPLVVGGLVIAATEGGSLYGLRDGRVVWRRHVGTPAPLATLPCGNIDPLGITGTPIYDQSTRLVYAVARLTRPDRHVLVAVDPKTGAERWRRSIDPPGSHPRVEQERGALTVAGGRVWVPFGGLFGDCGPYHGYVVGARLDRTGGLAVYQTPSSREAGIWTPPGPTVDRAGHLYVSVGNGASTAPPYDGSDSVVELAGTRRVSFFAPRGWADENAGDVDLGSQGPALVGRYVFIAGKSGTAYTLRAGRLGGIGGEVDSAPICRSFGGTAVSGDVVFVPCTDGVRAVRVSAGGRMSVAWHAPTEVAGSPVLGGGAVWAVEAAAGRLHQLDPGTGRDVTNIATGPLSRFATPTLAGRLVVVGTLSGVRAFRSS